MVKKKILVITIISFLLSLASLGESANKRLAFINANIFTPDKVIKGTMIIEKKRIAYLSSDIPSLDGMEVIDIKGKNIYPAIFDLASNLGIVEIPTVRGSVDNKEVGLINLSLKSFISFHADAPHVKVTKAGGVLYVNVAVRGELFGGKADLLKLDGWNWEDMLVKDSTGVFLTFPSVVQRGYRYYFTKKEKKKDLEKRRENHLKRIEKVFFLGSKPPEDTIQLASNDALETANKILSGKIPIWLEVYHPEDIEYAIDWMQRTLNKYPDIKFVLVTSVGIASFVGDVQQLGIPVVLTGVHKLPYLDSDAYDLAFRLPKILYNKGILFAISSGFDYSNVRNVPFGAATAVAYGLPKEVALSSITSAAAKIVGVDESLGSLEPGKLASFIVVDGDIFNTSSKIVDAWLEGKKLDISDNLHYKLYKRYLQRIEEDENR